MKHFLTIPVLFFSSMLLFASESIKIEHNKPHTQFSRENAFVSNHGQWDEDVAFHAGMQGMNAWVTDRGIVFDFFITEGGHPHTHPLKLEEDSGMPVFSEEIRRKGHVVKMHFVSPEDHDPVIRTYNQHNTRYSYFYGQDPSRWANRVPLYGEIVVEGIFGKDAGIDVRYYFDDKGLRYDFIVHPHAESEDIAFVLEGAGDLKIRDGDELAFETSIGEIRHTGLYAYQYIKGEKTQVPGSFRLKANDRIGFDVERQDPAKPLIIDPLIASTFIGGNITDQAYDMATDADGNIYIAGQTNSAIFPTTTGAYDEVFSGQRDVFISVFNADLTDLLYSTFLGDQEEDLVFALTLDPENNVYVTGKTSSEFFPVTPGVYDPVYNGAGDVFVSALNPDLSELLYSTFIGGTSTEVGYNILFDEAGEQIYITGYAGSSNYPTTPGAFQEVATGIGSVLVSALSPDLSELKHSTFITGDWWETGLGMTFNPEGNLVLTGETRSTNFPVTAGAYDETHNGGWDAFVSIIDPELQTLYHSTYLGGGHDDHGFGLDLDASGNIYVAGKTRSDNFPVSDDAYDQTFNALRDIFVSVFSPDLSQLMHATYLGGNTWDYANDITLSPGGVVCLTGFTSSDDYPVTPDAFNENFTGTRQVILSMLSPDLTDLTYSTFIGGSSFEEARKIIYTEDGEILLTGWTYSADFPVTPDAWDNTHNGGYDVFVSRFSSTMIPVYTLSLYAEPEDGGTVHGAGEYEYGQEVEVSAEAHEGYIFAEWTDKDGIQVSEEPVFLFSMPENDTFLTANFLFTGYTITFVIEDEDGEAINNAVITLNGEENPEGDYIFEGIHPGEYSYTVVAENYFDASGAILVDDSDKTVLVVMEEDDTGFAGTDHIELKVYPNPASGKLHVEFDNQNESPVNLVLMDILGRQVSVKVIQDRGHQLLIFDLDGLESGVYILRGEFDGQIIMRKISVQ